MFNCGADKAQKCGQEVVGRPTARRLNSNFGTKKMDFCATTTTRHSGRRRAEAAAAVSDVRVSRTSIWSEACRPRIYPDRGGVLDTRLGESLWDVRARLLRYLRATCDSRRRQGMDFQRLALLKRKLEALNYDGELDPKSAPLAEKVRLSTFHSTTHRALALAGVVQNKCDPHFRF